MKPFAPKAKGFFIYKSRSLQESHIGIARRHILNVSRNKISKHSFLSEKLTTLDE
jgi:hypothetical protein